jgi:hypothetical protein
VIARRCPAARVIDLTHAVARHDIRAGALALRAALSYCPSGSVHLAVVDPGVGGERRAALLVARDGTILVGPDNGLLWPAAVALGGVAEAYDISGTPERLEPVSATFHGRDLFAPVAAAACAGVTPSLLGQPVPVESLVALSLPVAHREGNVIVGHALAIDAFGNVALDVSPEDVGGHSALVVGEKLVPVVETFSAVAPGELLAYVDARGALALAVNRSSAAELLGLRIDDEIAFEVAP